MAATFANVVEIGRFQGGGDKGTRAVAVDVTGDASYPTGGYVGLAGQVADAAEAVDGVYVTENAGYLVEYVKSTDKLRFRQQPGTAAAGPSPEVPATTNLSAVTIRVVAVVL